MHSFAAKNCQTVENDREFVSRARNGSVNGSNVVLGLIALILLDEMLPVERHAIQTRRSVLLLAAAALLVGCSTDYQPIESRSPIVREGAYGTRKTVDGVDIWTFGEPSRKYQVLGIINDERLQAPFEMARYYHDVAAKVKQAGGNGAIEALSESQVTGIVSNSTTTSSGTVNAYGAGNAAVGRYSGSSNTTGFAAAQRHHSAKFIVVKYL